MIAPSAFATRQVPSAPACASVRTASSAASAAEPVGSEVFHVSSDTFRAVGAHSAKEGAPSAQVTPRAPSRAVAA